MFLLKVRNGPTGDNRETVPFHVRCELVPQMSIFRARVTEAFGQ